MLAGTIRAMRRRSRRSTGSLLPLVAAVLVVLAAAAFMWLQSRAAPATTTGATVTATATTAPAASPAAAAKPAVAGQARPDSKPTTATQAKPAAKPDTPADVDRARIAREATWTPGQLRAHFEKHGDEGPWASESVYDASAREVVTAGAFFTYVDRESNAERLGFYDKPGNRFTSVTRDGRRITTHFRPDRGEAYVRSLNRSTYR